MAVAGTMKWYGKAFLSVLAKEVDWENDAIKVALCTVDYVPDQDADDYLDDISNEVSTDGTGYSRKALTTSAPSYDGVTNTITLDGLPVEWDEATFTARVAVIFNDASALEEECPLLLYCVFDEDLTPQGGKLEITWHEDGLAQIEVANGA
jgi:hypothetical protein